jgi:hypothetical protein
MPKLSAPTDDFLDDLERFGVPFGVTMRGQFVRSPSSAWERVFNGPHGADGKPLNGGGLREQDLRKMRATLPPQQPNDASRRMSAASEATMTPNVLHSKPGLTFSAVRSPPAGAGARADDLGGSITTPEQGTSC